MVKITNVKVYDLEECIMACRNAMRLEPSTYFDEVPENLASDAEDVVSFYAHRRDDWEKSLKRAITLAQAPSNSGHANFLTGIRVSFDIKYPNYISPEMQRYHWFDIVTSSSKMHTLTKMAGDASRYNKYVKPEVLALMRHLQEEYNRAAEAGTPEDQYEAFMNLVSNCPQGIELFMRVSTNYMQLKTIYQQRKNHKLKEDWGAVCNMIRNLPYAKEFIIGNETDN